MFLVTWVARTCRSRASVQLEVAALRHQLALYKEEGRRPRIRPTDRRLWSWVSRRWSQWRRALYIVQPRTVLEWQKKRFRDYWRDLSCTGKPADREFRSGHPGPWRRRVLHFNDTQHPTGRVDCAAAGRGFPLRDGAPLSAEGRRCNLWREGPSEGSWTSARSLLYRLRRGRTRTRSG
jgi:hypothetical protein